MPGLLLWRSSSVGFPPKESYRESFFNVYFNLRLFEIMCIPVL